MLGEPWRGHHTLGTSTGALMWVLETEHRSSGTAAVLLSAEPSLQPPKYFLGDSQQTVPGQSELHRETPVLEKKLDLYD